jgi:hypothetical protein
MSKDLPADSCAVHDDSLADIQVYQEVFDEEEGFSSLFLIYYLISSSFSFPVVGASKFAVLENILKRVM